MEHELAEGQSLQGRSKTSCSRAATQIWSINFQNNQIITKRKNYSVILFFFFNLFLIITVRTEFNKRFFSSIVLSEWNFWQLPKQVTMSRIMWQSVIISSVGKVLKTLERIKWPGKLSLWKSLLYSSPLFPPLCIIGTVEQRDLQWWQI